MEKVDVRQKADVQIGEVIQMTNQEAIDLLDNLIGMIEDNHGSDYDSAIRMAIDALTEPEIKIGGDTDDNH